MTVTIIRLCFLDKRFVLPREHIYYKKNTYSLGFQNGSLPKINGFYQILRIKYENLLKKCCLWKTNENELHVWWFSAVLCSFTTIQCFSILLCRSLFVWVVFGSVRLCCRQSEFDICNRLHAFTILLNSTDNHWIRPITANVFKFCVQSQQICAKCHLSKL